MYTLSLGLFCCVAFAIGMVTRNCWAVVMLLFVTSMWAFAWYGSFFGLLISVEGPFYCVLLGCLFSLARRDVWRAGQAVAVTARL